MDKVKKKPKKKALKPEDWHYCHACQLKRGGVPPKRGMNGITVMGGKCSGCGLYSTLIPSSDYDWPKKGKKAAWD